MPHPNQDLLTELVRSLKTLKAIRQGLADEDRPWTAPSEQQTAHLRSLTEVAVSVINSANPPELNHKTDPAYRLKRLHRYTDPATNILARWEAVQLTTELISTVEAAIELIL